MTMEEMKAKVEALCLNEEFAEKAKACKTAQQVCDLYAQEGIIITPEELNAAIDAANKPEAEISEEDLDNVAGGFLISGSAFLAGSIIYALVTLQSAYVLGKYCR